HPAAGSRGGRQAEAGPPEALRVRLPAADQSLQPQDQLQQDPGVEGRGHRGARGDYPGLEESAGVSQAPRRRRRPSGPDRTSDRGKPPQPPAPHARRRTAHAGSYAERRPAPGPRDRTSKNCRTADPGPAELQHALETDAARTTPRLKPGNASTGGPENG